MKHETPKIKLLKKRIAQVGPVLPGRVRTLFLSCGKEACRCASGEKADKHGPYFFWDRKVNGKLSSMSLPAQDVELVTDAIENRKQLLLLLDELFQESAKSFSDGNTNH